MLKESVDVLKGVGEKVKEDLALMDIHTIEDLLYYFPYRYNIVEIKPLSELMHDEQATIVGTVIYDPVVNHYGRKKSRLTVPIQVDQTAVKAVMFNRAFAKNHLKQGETVTLTGKWDAHRLQITVSKYELGLPDTKMDIEPIYSMKGNMKPFRFKKLIDQCLRLYSEHALEMLPEKYLITYKLPSMTETVRTIHQPKSQVALKHARRRMIYEELLLFQLKMSFLKKIQKEATGGRAQQVDQKKLAAFMESLPYTLTNAQQKSLAEILSDMTAEVQMNRLLQGDVGSGKTAVATIALLATITAGYQGALMVPTEILAEQHMESICAMLGEEVRVGLLTSSVKGKKRKLLLEAIANNEIDLVVGTHSLIQEEVIFHRLGLVIIDEQHRFGVKQRQTLREKGDMPDVLFMTATPIPRTLAITAFGDMDVSIIDELPAGRKEIETYWVKDNMLDRVLRFIKKHVALGQQAYIVSPLIEESEAFDYQNAVDLYNQLQAYYPSEMKVGLLHGKMATEEKDEMMKRFMQNDVQILVSTTVIEVGVNVPNATIMVIYDAERFGLSQLHQLRGRVGRGDQQSYCILIADPKGEVGQERMRIMEETNDGFRLAEEDLKLRGPGDFFGNKQSGLPEFKVADLVHDYRALEVARQDATEIVQENLLATDPAYKQLQQYIQTVMEERRLD